MLELRRTADATIRDLINLSILLKVPGLRLMSETHG
jgi:hypothetical protein